MNRNELSNWFDDLCTRFFAVKISWDGIGSGHEEILGELKDKQAQQKIKKLIKEMKEEE